YRNRIDFGSFLVGLLLAFILGVAFLPHARYLVRVAWLLGTGLPIGFGYRWLLKLVAWETAVRSLRSKNCQCFLVRGKSVLFQDCPYHSQHWEEIGKTLGRKPTVMVDTERIQ